MFYYYLNSLKIILVLSSIIASSSLTFLILRLLPKLNNIQGWLIKDESVE